MACGEFAEPFYKLIEELGDNEEAQELVLNNLVSFLPGSTIESFVESFRRDYDLNDDTEDFETNEYVLCMECQDSYHEDELHECTHPPMGESKFFSSLIPEC